MPVWDSQTNNSVQSGDLFLFYDFRRVGSSTEGRIWGCIRSCIFAGERLEVGAGVRLAVSAEIVAAAGRFVRIRSPGID